MDVAAPLDEAPRVAQTVRGHEEYREQHHQRVKGHRNEPHLASHGLSCRRMSAGSQPLLARGEHRALRPSALCSGLTAGAMKPLSDHRATTTNIYGVMAGCELGRDGGFHSSRLQGETNRGHKAARPPPLCPLSRRLGWARRTHTKPRCLYKVCIRIRE